MALTPDRASGDANLPEDYHRDHPEEHPADWGWHGEWGRAGRHAGWVVAALLLVMITSTWYNFSGPAWLILIAAVLVVALMRTRRRTGSPWRAAAREQAQPSIGLCLFLIAIGMILEFVPRDPTRTTALNIIAFAIMIAGGFGLALRLTRWRQ